MDPIARNTIKFMRETIREEGWRFGIALYVRRFAWWLLRVACRIRGKHTYLDRLQQQCWCCDSNLMIQGQSISTAIMRRVGMSKSPEREVVERHGQYRAVRW